MSQSLKIGVIGAGVFGGYHAHKCMAHPRAELLGIYDHKDQRRIERAAEHAVKPYDTYDAMLADVEAVIIASPARTHGTMAIKALEAGKHCLIEKPMTTQLDEAQSIVSLAKKKNLVVQIGHQERFVMQAIGMSKITETPNSITGFRKSPLSARGIDASVTLDLMIHDLDLVLMLMGRNPDFVEGEGQSLKTDFADIVTGKLKFGKTTVSLMASRIHNESLRSLDVIYPSGNVSIDFNAKTLSHTTPFDLNADFGADPMAKDSLGAATNAFIEAVLDGKAVPVSAEDGYKALKLALIIDGEISWERNGLLAPQQ